MGAVGAIRKDLGRKAISMKDADPASQATTRARRSRPSFKIAVSRPLGFQNSRAESTLRLGRDGRRIGRVPIARSRLTLY